MWANCLRCVFFRFRPMGLPVNLLSITLEMSSRTFPELTIRIIVSVAVGWAYVTCCENRYCFLICISLKRNGNRSIQSITMKLADSRKFTCRFGWFFTSFFCSSFLFSLMGSFGVVSFSFFSVFTGTVIGEGIAVVGGGFD